MTSRILIVDDEPFNLEIISDYFEDSGHRLELFPDAEQAWAFLRREEPRCDLAIIDRMMPGTDGIALLRRIKADPRLATMPVIMQTAAASPEQLREGLLAGAYYYLTKPYERDSLLAIVRAALGDAAMQADLQARLRAQSDALRLLCHARFELRTIDEAASLAPLLAQLSPRPDTAVLGFSELLINAVEHGNLGISYAEKAELKRENRWRDEIDRRVSLPENHNKRVAIEVNRTCTRFTVSIRDEGCGFDWRPFLDFDPRRAFDPNGRGIALARLGSFDHLEYEGIGNIVHATILESVPGTDGAS